jgi:molybdopterin converting factor small subunit
VTSSAADSDPDALPDQATTVRYWAAAKAAAGVPDETTRAATLADALVELRGRHDERFTTVLGRCSFVVDGDPVGGRDHASVPLRAGGLVDVLPPFAGG